MARDNRERYRRKRLEEQFGHAGIPPRFHERGFDNYRAVSTEQYRVLQTCKAYAERFDEAQKLGSSLILIGRPGTGKTHLACAIARVVIEHGHSALFTSVAEMLRQTRDSFRGEETEQKILQRFTEPDLLILDEVGIGIGREETRHAIIMDVINRRYEHLRPTILMGNLSTQEMQAYLGERVWRRISEDGAGVLAFTWDRQNAGKGD